MAYKTCTLASEIEQIVCGMFRFELFAIFQCFYNLNRHLLLSLNEYNVCFTQVLRPESSSCKPWRTVIKYCARCNVSRAWHTPDIHRPFHAHSSNFRCFNGFIVQIACYTEVVNRIQTCTKWHIKNSGGWLSVDVFMTYFEGLWVHCCVFILSCFLLPNGEHFGTFRSFLPWICGNGWSCFEF